jgi:hypothetical protein
MFASAGGLCPHEAALESMATRPLARDFVAHLDEHVAYVKVEPPSAPEGEHRLSLCSPGSFGQPAAACSVLPPSRAFSKIRTLVRIGQFDSIRLGFVDFAEAPSRKQGKDERERERQGGGARRGGAPPARRPEAADRRPPGAPYAVTPDREVPRPEDEDGREDPAETAAAGPFPLGRRFWSVRQDGGGRRAERAIRPAGHRGAGGCAPR